MEAIIEAAIPVAVLVVDRPCRATELAAAAGIPSETVEWAGDRVDFTHRVVDALERHRVELVVMAGFMRILEKPIFDAFPGRVLNTHPSLLPDFRGAHAVKDALDAGATVTGCTIHVAVPEVDSGPILAQESVPVEEGDTVDTLHERIKAVEHRLYPETIKRFMEAGT